VELSQRWDRPRSGYEQDVRLRRHHTGAAGRKWSALQHQLRRRRALVCKAAPGVLLRRALSHRGGRRRGNADATYDTGGCFGGDFDEIATACHPVHWRNCHVRLIYSGHITKRISGVCLLRPLSGEEIVRGGRKMWSESRVRRLSVDSGEPSERNARECRAAPACQSTCPC